MGLRVLLRFAVIFALVGRAVPFHAQNLNVNYGAGGVQTLTFAGTPLEDVSANPADAFHIWHMSSTDLQGNPVSSGQYGWGESNNGRSWNAATLTWTYTFTWGTITTHFAQAGDDLDMTVTETNNVNSGIIFNGASIYPFALHFPALPAGFGNFGNQLADNTSGPSVTIADYGTGEVVAVAPDSTKALYSGFQPTGAANTYTALISSASPDSLATFLPHNNRPVAPGQSETFTVSLRFAPSGTAPETLAADAYQSWAATYPSALSWPDRRIIGTVYLSSAGSGPINQAVGYPNNPRRYFNDSNSSDFDVTTAAGLKLFQTRILQQAVMNVQNLQQLGAQGAITWDIEGEQYPQDTSYVCSPDQLAQVAPEMESIVIDSSSPYAGMPLIDAYFKIMTSAGFRTGVCIRPQQFTLNSDGTAAQVFLSNAQVAAQLIRKMQYAHSRWGTTLFYVDSTVDSNGGTLPAAIFQQVQAALPDSLIIPEETTPLHFAYTAPFASFIFHTDLGTNANVYNFYPHAFTANLVNDVAPQTLAQYQPQLIQSVRNGDILMAHADYWQANNPSIVSIYQMAGVTGASALPVITWAAPAVIPYGTPLSSLQLNATANVPGSFTYSPAAGTVLLAGSSTLSATFTPTNTGSYKSVTASTSLAVAKAAPTILWATPAGITAGTPLTASQLNATCSIPASVSYSPAAGTVLAAGTQTLTAICTPTDASDFTSASATVTLNVMTLSPLISFSIPAHSLGDPPFLLTATSSSPAAMVYSVLSGPALLVGTQLTLTGAGAVTLQVSQGASGVYSAATQDVSFLVLSGKLWLGKADAILSSLTLAGTSTTPQVSDFGGLGLSAIASPLGLAFDGSGSLWIANGTAVTEINPSDPTSKPNTFSGGGITNPHALAVDGAGQIWIANGTGTISVLSPSGAYLSPSAGLNAAAAQAPGGLTVDLSGNVWITNTADNSLTELVGVAAAIAPVSTSLSNGTVGARP